MKKGRQALASIDTNQLTIPKLKSLKSLSLSKEEVIVLKDTTTSTTLLLNDNAYEQQDVLLEELRQLINENINCSNANDRANVIIDKLLGKTSNIDSKKSIDTAHCIPTTTATVAAAASSSSSSSSSSSKSDNSTPFKVYNDNNDIKNNNDNIISSLQCSDDDIIVLNNDVNGDNNNSIDTSDSCNNTTIIIDENNTTLTSNDCNTTICIDNDCNVTISDNDDINVTNTSISNNNNLSSSPIYIDTNKETEEKYFEPYDSNYNITGTYNITVTVDSNYINDCNNIENISELPEYSMMLSDENGEFQSVIINDDSRNILNDDKLEEVEDALMIVVEEDVEILEEKVTCVIIEENIVRMVEENADDDKAVEIIEEEMHIEDKAIVDIVEEKVIEKEIDEPLVEETKSKVPKRRRRGSVCPSKALVAKVEKEQEEEEAREMKAEKPASRRLLSSLSRLPIIDNNDENFNYQDTSYLDDVDVSKVKKKKTRFNNQQESEKVPVVQSTQKDISLSYAEKACVIFSRYTVPDSEKNVVLCVLTAIISFETPESEVIESMEMLLKLVPYILPSENELSSSLNLVDESKKVYFAAIDGSSIQTPDDRRPSSWEACLYACRRLTSLLNEIKIMANNDNTVGVKHLATAFSLLCDLSWAKSISTCVQTVTKSSINSTVIWEFSKLIKTELVDKSDSLSHRITWMISSIIRAQLRWIFDIPPPQISGGIVDTNIDSYRSDLHKYVCLKMKPVVVTSKGKKVAKKKNDDDAYQQSNILEFTLSNLVSIALRQMYLALQHLSSDISDICLDNWLTSEWPTSSLVRRVKIAQRVIAAERSREFLLSMLSFPLVVEVNKKCTNLWNIIKECSQTLSEFHNNDDFHFTFLSKGYDGLKKTLSSSILSIQNIQLCNDTISTISGVTSLTNKRTIQKLADELHIDTYEVEDIILESNEFIFEFPEIVLLE